MQPSSSTDFVSLASKNWRAILLCLVLGVCGSVIYLFLAPRWYSATLTVVPAQRQDSMAMSLAAKLPVAFDSMSTDVQRIQAVFSSASVLDEVIDRFDLRHRYGVSYREEARKFLGEHCVTGVDKKSGVVSLTCEDKDPKIAFGMAAYFGDVGNRVFKRVSASSAREERIFLETQVQKARKEVDDLSQKLREFQEKHHVVDLSEQSKAVISAMATIQGELLSKQLELSYVSSFSAPTESNVLQLSKQIRILQSKLDQLGAQSSVPVTNVAAGSGTFFPAAMNVPELRFELEQLVREQKIRETVFFLLTQRFEMAKVDEARDTSTFQILDHPTIPTYRSRPRTKNTLIAGVGGGLVAAFGWIFVPFWWKRRTRVIA
jgi:tyrosine-protein kinase Etk/Wzc